MSLNPLTWFSSAVPVAAPVVAGIAGVNPAQLAAIQAILGQASPVVSQVVSKIPVVGSAVSGIIPSSPVVAPSISPNPLSQLATLQQTLIGLAAQITAVANQL